MTSKSLVIVLLYQCQNLYSDCMIKWIINSWGWNPCNQAVLSHYTDWYTMAYCISSSLPQYTMEKSNKNYITICSSWLNIQIHKNVSTSVVQNWKCFTCFASHSLLEVLSPYRHALYIYIYSNIFKNHLLGRWTYNPVLIYTITCCRWWSNLWARTLL